MNIESVCVKQTAAMQRLEEWLLMSFPSQNLFFSSSICRFSNFLSTQFHPSIFNNVTHCAVSLTDVRHIHIPCLAWHCEAIGATSYSRLTAPVLKWSPTKGKLQTNFQTNENSIQYMGEPKQAINVAERSGAWVRELDSAQPVSNMITKGCFSDLAKRRELTLQDRKCPKIFYNNQQV